MTIYFRDRNEKAQMSSLGLQGICRETLATFCGIRISPVNIPNNAFSCKHFYRKTAMWYDRLSTTYKNKKARAANSGFQEKLDTNKWPVHQVPSIIRLCAISRNPLSGELCHV